MSAVRDILTELSRLNIRLEIVDENIDIIIPDAVTMTDTLVEKIKKSKTDIIGYIRSSSRSSSEILPLAERELYELSPPQRRLWIVSQSDAGSVAYNMPIIFRFRGHLHLAAFRSAFYTLIERHESLRTVFRTDSDGYPYQHIVDVNNVGFGLRTEDLRHDPSSGSYLDAEIASSLSQPFDLSTGPLLRAALYRTAEDEQVFLLVIHHIVSDAWSMDVLMGELLLLYNAYKQGRKGHLPALPFQYKDYAAWCLNQLGNGKVQALESYWLNQFAGELPVLGLPGQKKRPRIKTYNGRMIVRDLSSSVAEGLSEYARANDVTLFMVLLAAVKALLFKYSGQRDIIVGSPVSGRENPDLAGQIGFYVNTIPLRTLFDGRENFTSLVQRIKKVTLDAYDNQLYPFDQLIEKLDMVRSNDRSPLFDIMVVLQNTGTWQRVQQEIELDGLVVSEYPTGNLTSKFDMTFIFYETAGGLSLALEFNNDIYTEEFTLQLSRHLEFLCDVVIKESFLPLEEIGLLSPEEKSRQILRLNPPVRQFTSERSVVGIFRQQANLTPQKTAVVFLDREMTYSQLDRLSDQFSNYLVKEHGIKMEQLVGIRMKRDEWMIVVMLGILKSGGAYVPIDPDYPEQLMSDIVADSGCRLIVEESLVRDFRARLAGYPPLYLPVDLKPDNLAYMIYTSGTTGKPKGVLIEHRSIIRLVVSPNYIDLDDSRILLVTGSPAFDSVIFEYWSMLLNGGKLVLAGKRDLLRPDTMRSLIVQHQVDTLWLTASWLNEIISADATIFKGVKTLIAGGDKLSPTHINVLLGACPGITVINGYGPTENTCFSLCHTITDQCEGDIPIGRPITNSTVYILDKRKQLLPPGVPGELYVGGDGLARGYHNLPALNVEKFVPHPFIAGERLYATGDMGKWLPDGTVEFIGRKDEQFKLRGYRIEPGEIESTLLKLPVIQQAVVAVVEREGEKEIVAYLVALEKLQLAHIKEYLRSRLPAYMIPRHLIQLPSLPLTDNGKIDRQALPDPESVFAGKLAVPPSAVSELEEQILKIWSRVLDREGVRPEDDFFELGGHSLRVTRLISLYEKELRVNLTIESLFEHTTVASQARLITAASATAFQRMEKAPDRDLYALSSAQKRLFFLHEFDALSVGYNIPLVNYIGREVDKERIVTVLDQLIRRHESLRTSFEKIDGEVYQRIHAEVHVTLDEYSCGLEDFRDYVKSYIRPFDLSKAPLMRSSLVKIDQLGYAWIVDMHHIISDGTSHEIMIEDFLGLYNGGELPALRLQYRDFSEWQNKKIQTGELQFQYDYWQRQLSGQITKVDLPGQHYRPTTFTFEGANHIFTIDKDVARKLQAFNLHNKGTLQMTLMAVLHTLFYKYTGQNDIITGCTVAGRRHSDLERIVGIFVNSLPVRTFPEGNISFQAFYKEVAKTCLSAYEHQDVQFEDIVDLLKVERDPSRNPIFDISLVVQNFERSRADESILLAADLNAAAVDSIRFRSATSKFDITWFVLTGDDDIVINMEYYTGVYDHATVQRMAEHFSKLLRIVLDNPAMELDEIDILTQEEEEMILSHYVNGEQQSFPTEATLHDLYELQALQTPFNTAVWEGNKTVTYKELTERSDQLSRFLFEALRLLPESRVAILQPRCMSLIVSILGVLKAGGAYVPLDMDYPEERLLYMLEDAGVEILLTNKELIGLAGRLQWRSRKLKHLVCLDTENINDEMGIERNDLMDTELWDHVGETAVDEISGGGWQSSYTGELLTGMEMREYAQNVYYKLKDKLHDKMRVLEIGCSSGITMFEIADKVGTYIGIDSSQKIISNTTQAAEMRGVSNVSLFCLPAHEIDRLSEGDFDLVIMNSVVHCFNGYNYLRNVLIKAISKMRTGGWIFLGDLMDEDKRTDLVADLIKFKEDNRDKGYRTKTDWSAELFISKDYLEDLVAENIGIVDAVYTGKIHMIPNELTRYRYDVLLRIDKTVIHSARVRKKFGHDLREIKAYPALPLRLTVGSDQLAYVIYTSGSSGKPKGVSVEHRSIINYIYYVLSAYIGNDRPANFGLFTSLSFDLTVTSIYAPLLSGGFIRMYGPSLTIDELLSVYFTEQAAPQLIKLTPSHIAMIGDLNFPGSLLKKAIVGGSELRPAHIDILRGLNAEMEIYNEYGPTEATVGCVVWRVKGSYRRVLIGRPIMNSSAYIVDKKGRLVPEGVAGEIWVGGAGIARGYLDKTELTREKFVDNLFAQGGKLYKTGDLGRWVKGGQIEFLGRRDDQVKVRGFRIELGEIEEALMAIPPITAALVFGKERKEGEQELVAYIVTSQDPDLADIKHILRERLPGFMIPAYFVQVRSFPLTPNGKINKNALPSPDWQDGADHTEYIAPSNATEQALVAIWQKVLGIGQIGIRDNFFALGGHSLKVTRLTSLYEKEFNTKVSLRTAFEYPTIEQHARLIDRSGNFTFRQIGKAEKKPYYRLSSAQRRLYFLNELASWSTGYNMPVLEYLGDTVDIPRLRAAFEELIARHEGLRTSFVKIEGEPYQKIHDKASFILDVHECDRDSLQEYLKSYIRPFDLREPPLIRASLVNLRGTGYILMFDEHHIISDGVSHELLIREFLQLYSGKKLSTPRLQYADFSEWQNDMMIGEEYDRQKKFWLDKFSNGIPKLDFYGDRPRPASFTFEGDRVVFTVDKPTLDALKELSQSYGGTMQMTLLSILQCLMHKYTGQEDIVIGCGIAGRNHADTENIYGMFVNSLAIRSLPSPDKTFSEFYREVRADCLSAYENQDVQFEDLVNLLQIKRDPSRNPLFDVLLVVQNFDRVDGSLPQEVFGGDRNRVLQEWEQIRFVNSTAKFDLTFHVWENVEEMYISVEYYSSIFDRSSIERLIRHFREAMSEVLRNPQTHIRDINILPEQERQMMLRDFVYGPQQEIPADASVHRYFSKQAGLTPNRIAVSDEFTSLTYSELELRSNQLSNYLSGPLQLPAESRVGVLQERNVSLMESILGILKAGGAYLPLDTSLPEERLTYMLEDAAVTVVITGRGTVDLANRLQWRCQSIKHIICIDSEEYYKERGGLKDQLMQKDLWDHVGDRAVDAITAGGWLSSYTGAPISGEEMTEYSVNAFLKLQPYLHREMKVLEIGCSSGLTMFRVAPHVQSYFGTDLSSSILEKTAKEAAFLGQENIFLSCLPAHEVDRLGERDFDLVIINSVIQCFEGHNYLRDVLVKAISLLKEHGAIFLGDVMDEDKREDMIGSLKRYKSDHPEERDIKTKTDWSAELFVSKDYINDLIADGIGLVTAEFSDKIHTIPNELTRFRYDAILQVDKKATAPATVRTRYQHDLKGIRTCSEDLPPVPVSKEGLCYVMYTSGSTGRPKGVMIEHRSVIRLVSGISYAKITENSCLLATGAPSFDATTFEFWSMLLNGGKLILMPQETLLDPNLLRLRIEEYGVNMMWFTSGWLNELVDHDITLFSPLECIVAGGDRLSCKHMTRLREQYPQLIIVNGYGPTENTTFSLTYPVNHVPAENIPIGKPISNSSAWILDKNGGLAPVGVVGEITLGGDGLARCYLNNAEFTEGRFIKLPHGNGLRLYKTGDLGRWLPDGNIEFFGRKDDQVKIRGYRIEPGEIENCLVSKDYIENAVVLISAEEGPKIVACIIFNGRSVDLSQIAVDLQESLPVYMIPDKFIVMDRFPLNPNGKVDRKMLLLGEQKNAAKDEGYVPPGSELENELVEIWKEVLGKEVIGIQDDFFRSGGHSLKAISLVSAYAKKFGVKVALKDLFEKTTIADQATLLAGATKQIFSEIPVADKQDSYPISDGQRRLWVLSQFREGSLSYNMSFSAYLDGTYDIAKFIRAIYSVIDRHEILRTVFREDEKGELRQWVLTREELGFDVVYKDFRDAGDKDLMTNEFMQQESARLFDLARGPLIRMAFIRLEDNYYLFYFCMHHIISDGLSMDVMTRDVNAYYNSLVNDIRIDIPDLRIQYKDYTVWQLRQFETETFKKAREYWIEKLKGDLPVLNLPTERSRPLIRTYNGYSINTYLPDDLSRRLKAYFLAQGGTLFMGLLAAVKILFHRYTGAEDIIIGSPISGREHKDLEDQIGFYVNTIVIRSLIDDRKSFDELLAGIKEDVLAAYSSQIYPFDRLLDELNIPRDTGRNPIFDVMVAFRSFGGILSMQMPKGWKPGEIIDRGRIFSKFDLEITFQEVQDHIAFIVDYNTDIYDRPFIERLIRHFIKLVDNLVYLPDSPVHKHVYLDKEEELQLLKTFNKPPVAFPEKTIIQLFREQVGKTPDHAAIVYNGRTLTYLELDVLSNQLGHYLQDRYMIQPDDLIGIRLDRSENFVVSVLGVLKSGAGYMPVNIDYPEERIAYMEKDSHCVAMIDDTFYAGFLDQRGSYSQLPVSATVGAENLVYLMYTSGSTGNPKGIMMGHGAMANLVNFHIGLFSPGEVKAVTQFYSISFDASFQEIFTTLLAGATLYPVPEDIKKSVGEFTDFIIQNKIDSAFLPTAYFKLLMEEEYFLEHIPAVLDHIIVAGEQLLIGEAFMKLLNGGVLSLHNHYGPTETHAATAARYGRLGDSRVTNLPSIGKPISSAQIYILDAWLNLMPVGATGEIFIGGAGLAKGYINQQALTEEKFIPNPYRSGELMYRTGDLGKWSSAGEIEYIGRKDDQVKIRGYRVEPGEIEKALLQLGDISNLTVLTRENGRKEKELLAYFVSVERVDGFSLKNRLKSVLPEFMIPSYFLQVDSIPLTFNGKVNRKALPEPEGLGITARMEYKAPGNEMEAALVQMWEDVLERRPVGVNDNFFELGGHSIKLIRLLSKYHKAFDVRVSIPEVFINVTISEHASLLKSLKKAAYLEIEHISDEPYYKVSSGQRRLWMLSQIDESSLSYNMSGAYSFKGELDIYALNLAFESTVRRHESLRTVFRADQHGEVFQHVLTFEDSGFKMGYTDLRADADRMTIAKGMAGREFVTGFDLADGPLLRAALYRLEKDEYVLTFTMHHIISDGWSMEVLMQELLLLYGNYRRGNGDNLPPLRIQHRDYAAWQQRQLQGESFNEHRQFWLRQFQDEIPVLSLPSQKARPLVKTYNGSMLRHSFDGAAIAGIKAISVSSGGTLFMGLLAVVNILLYKLSGDEDIIIGTPIAGREHADLEGQIGFFVNTLALRILFGEKDSFKQVFHKIKEVTLAAYEHQIYPFDQLVDDLRLSRDMGRSPLFDIMVVLGNTELGRIGRYDQALEGINISGFGEGGGVTSKFDLTFMFTETPGGLDLLLEYNSDIYDKEFAERLFGQLDLLLTEVVLKSNRPVFELDCLSNEERDELLFGFNNTAANHPGDLTIVDLFREQVRRTPDRVAVVHEGVSHNYREIDLLSNRLAHYLRDKCEIEPDLVIGIQLERSTAFIVSILGVLKSGAAYLALDPGYPEERIDLMKRDSSCLLTIDSLLYRDFYFRREEFPASAVAVELNSDNLVYLIYTSGSTGTPKGIMMPHSTMVNMVLFHRSEFPEGEVRSALLLANIGFDVIFTELFVTLLSGATLYPLSEEKKRDPNELAGFIADHHIDTLYLPTAYFRVLSEDPDLYHRIGSTVRFLMVAGEQLVLSETFLSYLKSSPLTLYNHYGPSETHMVTSCRLSAANISLLKPIPSIGRPIANTRVFILNDDLRLVSIGVTGEICVAGMAFSKGYLNQEALTREKFVPNPYEEGGLMYRTGDIGRWLEDGTIEYIGRRDQQVKIRGYRIEPGEIESALLELDGIENAVVVARDNGRGQKELVAYVVSAADNLAGLRAELRMTLPEYMVPSYFVRLAGLPLTPNGKVDKRSLPDPGEQTLSGGTVYTVPSNDMEEQLAAIWEELLGRAPVGVDDDFFELGGNSLRAIQLVRAVSSQLTGKITLKTLYQSATIRSLALALTDKDRNDSLLIPLNRIETGKKNMVLIPAISGNANVFKDFAASLSKDYNCYGVNYPGLDTTAAFDESIDEMASHFCECVVSGGFDHSREIVILGYSMGAIIAFEVVKELEKRGYSCKLIVVDRAPNKSEVTGLMNKYSNTEIEEYVISLSGILYGADIQEAGDDGMRQFLRHHLEVQDKHLTSGQIVSDILSIDAITRSPGKMGVWAEYTSGKHRVVDIDAGHFEVFDKKNISLWNEFNL